MAKIDLSEEEVRLIMDKRQKEEAAKPKFTGKLKCDLYMNHCLDSCGRYTRYVPWICSIEERDEIVAGFTDSFEKVLSAGAIFDCYIESNGVESWYDRDYGIENMGKEWAREYLINIKRVRKTKKKKKS